MSKQKYGVLFLLLLLLTASTTAWAKTTTIEKKEPTYYITVNVAQNTVTIYEDVAETAIKAFACSVGEETPLGSFRTSSQYQWRPLFGDVYGQYATRITGHILFHSVPYLEMEKDTLEYEEYNKLGETASAGCIRLTTADAKWIYDNCPAGTRVDIYESQNAEPITPAKPVRIGTNDVRKGWDPTDPDEDNPWQREKVSVAFQAGSVPQEIDLYVKDDSYYIAGQDAKTVFALMGKMVLLPQTLSDENQAQAAVRYLAKLQNISCFADEDRVYYSLRELADMAGITLRIQPEDNTIVLHRQKQDKVEQLVLSVKDAEVEVA